jgi:hypothetical protein
MLHTRCISAPLPPGQPNHRICLWHGHLYAEAPPAGSVMPPRAQFNPLGELLALLMAGALIIAGLEWLGYDIGWRPWLACRLRDAQSLFTLGIMVGVGLLFFRASRPAGIGLVLLALGGSYGLELYGVYASGCPGGAYSPASGGP